MEKFNTDLTQVIKWEQNKAPNIQSLVLQKYDWYKQYNDQFWADWYTDIFNIDTCNAFGIYIWCEILGVPREKIVLTPITNKWAFGDQRENYIYSGANPSIPVDDRNLIGGNFVPMSNDIITDIEEARTVLKLRYMTLTSDGRVANINRMLNWIYNKGEPWDYPSGKYVYLSDLSQNSSIADDSGYYVVNDWQGRSEIPLGYSQLQYTSGMGRDVAAGGGLNRPTSRMESPLYYQWSGYPAADPGTPRAEGVGGDTQLWGGPDKYGEIYGPYPQSPYNDTYASATRLIKSQEPPATSITGLPTQDLVYCCRVDGSFGLSGNTALPTTVGAKVVLSTWVRATDPSVKCIQLREYAATFSSPTKIADPVSGYFNIDGSMDYSIRGVDDDLPRDPTRGGIQKYPDNWYRIWIVEEIATTTANVLPNLGVIPWQSDAFSTSKVTIPIGASLLVWGYTINDCTPGYNDNEPPYFFPCPTVYKDTSYPLFNIVVSQPFVNITTDLGMLGLTYPGGSPNSALLQPGATFAFQGFLSRLPFSSSNLLISDADGESITYQALTPPGFTPPYTVPMSMRYTFGRNFTMSAQMFNLISNRANGILPANAGIGYLVTVYNPALSDIDLTAEELDSRITISSDISLARYNIGSDGKFRRVTDQRSWPLTYDLNGNLQGRYVNGQIFGAPKATNKPLDSTSLVPLVTSGNTATFTALPSDPDELPKGTLNFVCAAGTTQYAMMGLNIASTTSTRMLTLVIESTTSFTLSVIPNLTLSAAPALISTINVTPGKRAYSVRIRDNMTAALPNRLTFGIYKPSSAANVTFNLLGMFVEGLNGTSQIPSASWPDEVSTTYPNGMPTPFIYIQNPSLGASGVIVYLKDGTDYVIPFNGASSVILAMNSTIIGNRPRPDYYTQCAIRIQYIPL